MKWLTDITEFEIPASKVYLSPIISWSIGTKPDAGLVNTMLDAAIGTVDDGEQRPIIHSDRGAHYCWPGWLNRISNAQLVRSMSRKSSSQDNAACEGFFGRLKTELFYARDSEVDLAALPKAPRADMTRSTFSFNVIRAFPIASVNGHEPRPEQSKSAEASSLR